MVPVPPIFFLPLCPLVGAVLSLMVGIRQPKLSGWVATVSSASAFLLALAVFVNFTPIEGASLEERLFTWIAAGNVSIDFALRLDSIGNVMCLFVTGVSALIHLYSIGYMRTDLSRPRFFAYLNLFVSCMLLLVTGANLPVLFIGWEGVGLCSYLLIGFWFTNEKFASAGRKAFIVNRIGDAGLLLGMFLLIREYGTLDFYSLSSAVASGGTSTQLLNVMALCLFCGAVGKSAQIPLFVWLPDAMAGPTPVSALIHAATMVTAGIYLLIRTAFLFESAAAASFIVILVGLLTAFMAATIALTQFDIKKVLAYSTISQLGLMFVAAGSGAFAVALFHVVTHAFFKACLFLGAGSVITGCHHEQDMRELGGLRKLMPVTCATYGVAALAIAGIYPLSGYYSKHAILESLQYAGNPFVQGYTGAFLMVAQATAVLTGFYMARSFALTFLGKYRGHATPHESPWTMTLPLIILAVLSAGGGLLFGPRLFEYLSRFFVPPEHPAGSFLAGLGNSWPGILGVGAGFLFYTRWRGISSEIYSSCGALSRLLSGKYYVDEMYETFLLKPLRRLSIFLFNVVDQRVVDGTVNASARATLGAGLLARYTQTGQLRYYALMMLSGLVVILFLSFKA